MNRLCVAFLVPLIAGCYTYHPAPRVAPPPGERVRLTLTDSGTAMLAAQLGPSTEALSGQLVLDSAGAYIVAVRSTRHRNGIESDWRGEQVSVPRPLVGQLEERRFSRTKTVLMTVGLAVGAFVVREAFWGPGKVFGGAPPGGGPPPR